MSQAALAERLEKSKSQVCRLMNGQVRYADPEMGAHIEKVTARAVSAADYTKFIAACVAARRAA